VSHLVDRFPRRSRSSRSSSQMGEAMLIIAKVSKVRICRASPGFRHRVRVSMFVDYAECDSAAEWRGMVLSGDSADVCEAMSMWIGRDTESTKAKSKSRETER